MEGSGSTPTPAAAVQKRQYRNNTLGWLGVVVLSPRGDPSGVSVEPQGTVWLSDDEAILTARAPRLPKDNPFEEQVFYAVDADGKQVEQRVRPLVPISESRWVPQEDRYLPPHITGAQDAGVAAANALGEDPAHTSAAADPVSEAAAEVRASADPAQIIPPTQTDPAPPIPGSGLIAQPPISTPATQAVATAPNTPPGGQDPVLDPLAPEEPQSWTEPPNGELTAKGELIGENVDDSPPPTNPLAIPDEPAVVAATTADGSPAAAQGAGVDPAPVATEEVAAVAATPVGEETGASVPPAGDAPEGEFAVHEEIGSPDAPKAGGTAP